MLIPMTTQEYSTVLFLNKQNRVKIKLGAEQIRPFFIEKSQLHFDHKTDVP